MISHTHQCIFIHINKCAGTSIQSLLKQYGGNFVFKNHQVLKTSHRSHVTAYQYSNLEYWNRYFKFAVVRNPWDKELSDYFFHNKKQEKHKSFEEYLKRDIKQEQKIWHTNQIDWLRSSNNNLELDFICRFETLEQDISKVFKKINITNYTLEKLNTTSHKHYSHYYNPELIEIVNNLYSKDIEYFDYQFYKSNNE